MRAARHTVLALSLFFNLIVRQVLGLSWFFAAYAVVLPLGVAAWISWENGGLELVAGPR
jgi:hypothetical protein